MNAIDKIFDRYPAIPIGILVGMLMHRSCCGCAWCCGRGSGLPDYSESRPAVRRGAGPLEATLVQLDRRSDPFRVRDLLNGGVAIFGRAGSGKTSSSGRTLLQAIVNFDEEKMP